MRVPFISRRPSREEQTTEDARTSVKEEHDAARKIMDAQFESLFTLMADTLASVTHNKEDNNKHKDAGNGT